MKYLFIPFVFFPIYLMLKALGLLFVLFTTLIVLIWRFEIEIAMEWFREWDTLFAYMSFNPFHAWYHFLDGLEELDLI